jgi:hypothetical protein
MVQNMVTHRKDYQPPMVMVQSQYVDELNHELFLMYHQIVIDYVHQIDLPIVCLKIEHHPSVRSADLGGKDGITW